MNTVGTSEGFSTIATVADPLSNSDGEKGVTSYAGKLKLSGIYKFVVSRNLMASTANFGSFLLEVVRY